MCKLTGNDKNINEKVDIDSDFEGEEYQNDRVIRGEPLYYTTGQVAEKIGEPDSTIRYWCDEFDEFLKIKKTGPTGTRRQFTKIDIKRIEYIKYLLKDENLSIKQVKEFLSTPEAEKMLPVAKEKEQIMIEAFANTISSLVEKAIDEKIKQIEDMFVLAGKAYKESQEKFKEEIMKEVSATLSEELNDGHEKIKNEVIDIIQKENRKYIKCIEDKDETFRKYLNDRDKALLERDRELIEEYRKRMDEQIEEMKRQKQKGILSRIFGK